MGDTVLVLGSGPIRIGQGIEFDYSCVHSVWALQAMGYRAVIQNNNPETVSTDWDTGDALYFEPVTLADVLKVVEHESPIGVVVQFGGQTAINLAQGLQQAGVRVLGTSPESIALAEDRAQFDRLLQQLNIQRPQGRAVTSLPEAVEVVREIGFPVLVRPSFVLGGRAMEIVHDATQLKEFYALAEEANPGQPVLVDRYVLGREAEMDVICDGDDTLVPGIMEHIERAGVHSGDSMAVYPPVTLSASVQARMVEIASTIAKALNVRGLMNIQFVLDGDEVNVLEVNPRASRTVPFLSKVTGIPMVRLATHAMMGRKLADLGLGSGLWVLGEVGRAPDDLISIGGALRPGPTSTPSPLYAVKAPVFSFQKLHKVEPSLGPEMKSTGEVMGVDRDYRRALFKALIASGITFKAQGRVLLTLNSLDKLHAAPLAKALHSQGYRLTATSGTFDTIRAAGIPCESVKKIQEGSPNLLDLIREGQVSLMVNTPSASGQSTEEAKRIRRACIETGVACITSIDTALALADALEVFSDPGRASCEPYTSYLSPG